MKSIRPQGRKDKEPSPPADDGDFDEGEFADTVFGDSDDIATGSQPALAANKAPAPASATPRKPVTAAIATPSAFSGRFVWPVPGKVIARFGPPPEA